MSDLFGEEEEPPKEPETERPAKKVRALGNVDLYTDGACVPNPGQGGWAFILINRTSGDQIIVSGAQMNQTTNNRMELMAVIKGLKRLKRLCRVRLFTDSMYAGDGITIHMDRWRRDSWCIKQGSRWVQIKNQDLWWQLADLREHEISFHHIKGHTGDPLNEECHRLAELAATTANRSHQTYVNFKR